MECNLDKFMKYQNKWNDRVLLFATAVAIYAVVMEKRYTKDKKELQKIIEEMKVTKGA